MPAQLKRALEAGARKHHFKKNGPRWNAYVYGAKPMQRALKQEQKRRRK